MLFVSRTWFTLNYYFYLLTNLLAVIFCFSICNLHVFHLCCVPSPFSVTTTLPMAYSCSVRLTLPMLPGAHWSRRITEVRKWVKPFIWILQFKISVLSIRFRITSILFKEVEIVFLSWIQTITKIKSLTDYVSYYMFLTYFNYYKSLDNFRVLTSYSTPEISNVAEY